MKRCSCCKARMSEAVCKRCGADFTSARQAEHWANHWLAKSVDFHRHQQFQQSITALELSIGLASSSLANCYRRFLIDFHGREILALLQNNQLLVAKLRLFQIRRLIKFSTALQQLRKFVDFLDVNPVGLNNNT